jgi:hypothetical protein
MEALKCPACRRRFALDSEFTVCARCGADLSLLIRLQRHARQLAVTALSACAANQAERRAQLQKAQRICFSPAVQQLLDAWDAMAPCVKAVNGSYNTF